MLAEQINKFFNSNYLGKLLQCSLNDLIHIIILVLAQSPAENNILFFVGKCSVLLIKRVVFIIIDRIIRLITGFPYCRILFCYYSVIRSVSALAAKLKMFVFNYPHKATSVAKPNFVSFYLSIFIYSHYIFFH